MSNKDILKTANYETKSDIIIRKVFDIKFKIGNEINFATIDENKYLETFLFLKNNKIYFANIISKQHKEFLFFKGKEIIYLNSNQSNEIHIAVDNYGNVYLINSKIKDEFQVDIIKGMIYKSSLFEGLKNKQNDFQIKNNIENKIQFQIHVDNNGKRILIINDKCFTIWYNSNDKNKNENNSLTMVKSNSLKKLMNKVISSKKLKSERSHSSESSTSRKDTLNEKQGTYYSVSLENEIKIVVFNKIYYHSISYIFCNTFENGNCLKISYIVLNLFDETNILKKNNIELLNKISEKEEIEVDSNFNSKSIYRLTIINYIFTFNSKSNFKLNIQNISKKINYFPFEFNLKDEKLTSKRIVSSYSKNGDKVLICTNSEYNSSTRLFIYYDNNYKIVSVNLSSLIESSNSNTSTTNIDKIWVEDIGFLLNDTIILILFKKCFICFIDINFNLLSFIDISKSIICPNNNITIGYPINYSYSAVNIENKIIISSNKEDYFLIITNNYSICYQLNFSNYKEKIFKKLNNVSSSLITNYIYIYQILSSLKTKRFKNNYFYFDIKDSDMLDKIHDFMIEIFNKFTINNDQNIMRKKLEENNEINDKSIKLLINFIQIFRKMELSYINLTISIYMNGIINDLFYYYISIKNFHLAFIILKLSEIYYLNKMKIKINKFGIQIQLENMNNNIYTMKSFYNQYFSKNSILLKYILPSLKSNYLIFNIYPFNNIINNNLKTLDNFTIQSKLRVILILSSIIESQNFMINENKSYSDNEDITENNKEKFYKRISYFLLSYNCFQNSLNNNIINEFKVILKSILRNYKYLKSENKRYGKEEFLLNGLTINLKTELLTFLLDEKLSREDIDFQFLESFFSTEDIPHFNNISKNFTCENNDNFVIEELTNLNHSGKIMKWIYLLNNNLFLSLLNDCKIYFSKSKSNINKIKNNNFEIKNVIDFISFNMILIIIIIIILIKQIIIIDLSNFTFRNYSSYKINSFSKLKMINLIDIPLLIMNYNHYFDNKNNKIKTNINLSKFLIKLIESKSKNSNINYEDGNNLINILFTSLLKDFFVEYKITFINNNSKKIFTCGIIYIFLHFKFDLIQSIDFNLISLLIDELEICSKQLFIDFLYNVLNGYLKYYLFIEQNSKLSDSKSISLEIILFQIKSLFYKIVREETYLIKNKIYEYVFISPALMKPYLLEGGLFYEYKYLNGLIKSFINSTKFNIIDIKLIIKNEEKLILNNLKIEKDNNLTLSSINFLKLLFLKNKNYENKLDLFFLKFIFHKNKDKKILGEFKSTLRNLLNLLNISNYTSNIILQNNILIFNIESSIFYIRKIIINSLCDNNIKYISEYKFQEIFSNIIDKLIKINFNSKLFKFSSKEIKIKLTSSIKLIISKLIYILTLIRLKFLLAINDNEIKKIETLSFLCILDEKFNSFSTILNIIDFIKVQDCEFFKKKESLNICKNINFSMLYMNKSFCFPKLFENFLISNCNDFYSKYKEFIENEFQIIKKVFSTINDNIKNHNTKNLILLLFNDYFVENLLEAYCDIKDFISSYSFNHENFKKAKQLFAFINTNFEDKFGIDRNGFLEFEKKWKFNNNEELFSFIIFDKDDNLENKICIGDEIIQSKRQRSGIETPRKDINGINLLKEIKRKSFENNLSKSLDSIEIKENIEVKGKLKTNKIKLPKYRKQKTTSNNKETFKDDEENMNNLISILINVIFRKKKNYFEILKNYSFMIYKMFKIQSELDDITIINLSKDIKDKISSVEKIELNEKYDQETSKLNKINKIKSYDILNIPKYNIGFVSKSNIIKTLINKNSSFNFQNEIKTKINDIQLKINKFENLAKSIDNEINDIK